MTANQAARHQLRLTEDRIKPDVGYARPLPAPNRILYVLRGHLTVKIGGTRQLFVLMAASQFFGNTRGKLSTSPPPVICARPWIIPAGTFARSG